MLLISLDGAIQRVVDATQGCLPLERGNMGSLAEQSRESELLVRRDVGVQLVPPCRGQTEQPRTPDDLKTPGKTGRCSWHTGVGKTRNGWK